MQTIKHLLAEKGKDVWSTDPDDSVFDAISRMAEKNVGALVVLANGELVGIISERDYTRKVILEGKASKDTRVRDIMSARVVCGNPEQTVEEGLALMTDKHVRHLPILDGTKLVGIVSIGDLVKIIIADQKFIIEQLEHYIAG